MGADGHIGIYSRSKFEAKFGKGPVKEFCEQFLGSKFYTQTLEGAEYLTRYWGDNLQYNDLFETIEESYSKETDSFNTKSWGYDRWHAEQFMELPKAKRHLYTEMIRFLDSYCRLTEWEVWT